MMNENLVKKVVQEFSKDNISQYEKTFSIVGNDTEIFTVRIERKRRILVNESIALESRFNTISALPSGAPCGCCGGSGRS